MIKQVLCVIILLTILGCEPSDIKERRKNIVMVNNALIEQFDNVDRNDPNRLKELIGELNTLETEVKAYTEDANNRGCHKNNDELISNIENRIGILSNALSQLQQKGNERTTQSYSNPSQSNSVSPEELEVKEGFETLNKTLNGIEQEGNNFDRSGSDLCDRYKHWIGTLNAYKVLEEMYNTYVNKHEAIIDSKFSSEKNSFSNKLRKNMDDLKDIIWKAQLAAPCGTN